MAAAKIVALKVAPVIPEEEDEPPKCPPVGAPAWLATFADIATNLMAFFVLILGFAKFDEVSFKKMAGSMRETFGTEMVAPLLENPEGGTVLEMSFQPQGLPPDQVQGEEPPKGDEGPWQDRDGESDSRSPADQMREKAAQAAAKALMDALASGEVKVEQGKSQVTIRLPEGENQPTAETVADALARLARTDPEPVEDPTSGATNDSAEQVAEATTPPDQPAEAGTGEAAPGSGGAGGTAEAGRGTSPGFAEAKLGVALRDQSAQGLVEVERRDGSVFVTVGAGGAFSSGSAELTAEAREILGQIAENGLAPGAKVTITGHTDNVPLANSPFGDNFGLGAARASAVAQEMVRSGLVRPDQISVVSKGETAPVADNLTEDGRAQNRRIEIEIDYDGTAAE
ncbi:OmpA family protein [Fuscovulum ytuae]|uniref:OmpA family protein n=1 Tax=Fuscovulum ytuae TaxID=3042299 RepID=A0ABY8Q3K3_9RHOB|nr:OmpA family protein [Fuscovulum sp. YMD61]WGV14935.1 OmpA family protein [Fuscovulum sp. YMD61]